MRMKTSKWLLTVFVGFFIGVVYALGPNSPGLEAQDPPPWCNQKICIEICVGNICEQGCSNSPSWDCAGPPFGEGGTCKAMACCPSPPCPWA